MANPYGRHGLVRPSPEKLRRLCDDLGIVRAAENIGIARTTISQWRRDAGLTTGKREDRPIRWKADKNGCWNCTSHKPDSGGYPGGKRLKGRRLIAKVMYEEKFGKIDKTFDKDGVVMMHKCDNRMCVNPDHLMVGTTRDNMMDAYVKGRNAYGERHGMAKLNLKDVEKVKRLRMQGYSYSKIAEVFGVTTGCIWFIVKGKSWRRATGLE